MLRLMVTAGPAAGAEIEVDDELVIGRGAPGLGSLAGDPEISRRHARVSRESEAAYAIEDLGSKNGTHVNGRPISRAQAIHVGDSIEVGASTLVAAVIASAPSVAPAAAAPPRVSLRLELDFATAEARVEIDGRPQPVLLVPEDGGWRVEPAA